MWKGGCYASVRKLPFDSDYLKMEKEGMEEKETERKEKL